MRSSPMRGMVLPATVQAIGEVANLRARGYDWQTVAAKVGRTVVSLKQITKRQRKLYRDALAAAMEEVCREVKELAGSDRMLPIIGEYVAAAENAEHWSTRHGKPLFPLPSESITGADGGCHTLASFFERYYLPICLADGSPATVHLYRVTLRKWAMLTGDPPLKAITADTLAGFRKALLALRKSTRKKLNPITARNYLRHVQILLDKCGPRGRRNRDAAGYLAESPWIKPIKAEMPEPKTVPLTHLAACYEAADAAEYPKLPGVSAADWWRCLLAVTYNLGLRRRTLFSLRWSMVDWEAKLLRVPGDCMKGRKRLTLPLNDVVLAHLRRIEGAGDQLVFPWPHSREWFGKQFHLLQTSAGIMQPKQFGVHRIRKTCATVLWKKDRAAAQLMLGHTALAVTQQHYIDAIEGLSEAVAAMPQPAGFAKGGAA